MEMTASDWITIVTSIVATVAAIIVAWKLYQLQQSADLRLLAERIKELSDKDDTKTTIEDKIEEFESLISLREQIVQMNSQLISSVQGIHDAIDLQQTKIEKSINNRIIFLLDRAKKEFEDSVRKELKEKLSQVENSEEITNDLVDVFVQTTRTLTDVQSGENAESNEIKAELRVKRPFNEVRQAMHELKEMISMPALLGGPSATKTHGQGDQRSAQRVIERRDFAEEDA